MSSLTRKERILACGIGAYYCITDTQNGFYSEDGGSDRGPVVMAL